MANDKSALPRPVSTAASAVLTDDLTPYDMEVRRRTLFDESVLRAEGRAKAVTHTRHDPPAKLEASRASLQKRAKDLVHVKIPDHPPHRDDLRELARKEWEHLHQDRVPRAKQVRDTRKAELEAVEDAGSVLGPEREKPNTLAFAVMAALTGVLFGLFASTTFNAVISEQFFLDAEKNPKLVYGLGLLVGLLVGLVVGVIGVVLGRARLGVEYYLTKHAPALCGIILAITLAAFRFDDENQVGYQFTVSGGALTLLGLEIFMALTIEFINVTYFGAWEKYEADIAKHGINNLHAKRAKERLDEAAAELTELETLEQLAIDDFRRILHDIGAWENDREHRPQYEEWVAGELLSGFEQAFAELKQ